MKFIMTLVLGYLLSIGQVAAHGGNHEEISQKEARNIALNTARQYSRRDSGKDVGKLSASWRKLNVEQVSVTLEGKGYYIVEVKNLSEKKSMFLLMSDGGDIYDANFVGTFDGIN